MKIDTIPLTLHHTYQLTDSVRHFVFECSDDAMTSFVPGQFITMHLPYGEKVLKRSYSIANQCHSSYIEFAAGFVPEGPASELLFSLNVGDIIQANGPFGRLLLKDEPVKRYYFVATSTGITPCLSMLNSLTQKLKNDPSLEVHILQGIRTANDLLYKEEFLNFAKNNNNAFFYACYSREDKRPLEQFEYLGYVQNKLNELSPFDTDDITYLCGNPEMVDACYKLLTSNNVDIKQIRREKYISK